MADERRTPGFMTCPKCGETAECDAVDFGVGTMERGNWHCDSCHWETAGDEIALGTFKEF